MDINVLIVAENASTEFGGEASLPLHYYRILRRRKIPVWLLIHERSQDHLKSLFPSENEPIIYVTDTIWHRFLWQITSRLPERLSYLTTGFIMRLLTQLEQRRIIHRLVQEHNITVIHQPIPVSPREPSMIFGMGVPVVIGPMNGGMDYPHAFQRNKSYMESFTITLGRKITHFMN